MRWLLPVLLWGCAGPSTTDDPDDPAVDPTAPAWWDAQPDDVDGDGAARDQGDCDDADPTVNPFVTVDACNGRDDDCDGEIDEDGDRDTLEPNDTAPVDLGRLSDSDEVLITAWAFPEGDVDTYRFWVPDPSFGWFSVEGWVHSVPPGVDVAVSLHWVEDPTGQDRGLVDRIDDEGPGGTEVIDHGGDFGVDDEGWYELRVETLSGSACDAPYTLQILTGGI